MYNLTEVMEMVDVSERTIRRHLKVGLLKGTKVSGKWSFNMDDIEAYLNNKIITKILKTKVVQNFDEFVKGVSPLNGLSMYSTNLKHVNVKTIAKQISSLQGPMDLKINKHGTNINVTFYGSNDIIKEVINVIRGV